jgi:hypothetical protein
MVTRTNSLEEDLVVSNASAFYNKFAGTWLNMPGDKKKCPKNNFYTSAPRCERTNMKDVEYVDGELKCIGKENNVVTEHLCEVNQRTVRPHEFSKVYLFARSDLTEQYKNDYKRAKNML